MNTLRWRQTLVRGEITQVSHDARFSIVWAGRLARAAACYQLWDGVQRKHYRGFISAANAQDMAERITNNQFYKVGLVACCGKKLPYRAPARYLYQSDLFKKAARFAAANYDEWFILSARYGLVHPDEEIAPYDLTLKGMQEGDIRRWVDLVADQVDRRACKGEKRRRGGGNALRYCALFYMHTGKEYSRPLEAHIPMEQPLRGLGIGRQLAFYKSQEERRCSS